MSFLLSILANLATIPIVILTVYLIGHLTRRRALLRFFTGQSSLTPGSTQFSIYLSSLKDSPGGLSSVWEFTEARNLQDLFLSLLPGPSGGPGPFRDILVTGIECTIKPVQESQKPDLLKTNCLIVGSPMYNGAARMYNQQLTPPARHEPTDKANDHSPHHLILPLDAPNPDERRGVIVRICRGGASYFYTAGPTEYSTAAALYILRRQWRSLYNQFGRAKSFLVQIQAISDDYRLAVEVSRSELPDTTPQTTVDHMLRPHLPAHPSGAIAPVPPRT